MPRTFGSLLLALALAFCGCHRQSSSTSASPLKFQTRKFEKALPGCGPQGQEPCATFNVEWREVSQAPSSEARTRINAAIQAHLQPAEAPRGFEAESQAFFEDFQEFKKEFPESRITYFIRRSADVIFNNASLLCVVVFREEFSGGAHPVTEVANLNLRPNTGEPVQLESLLNNGAKPALVAAVEAQFRTDHSIPAGQPLSEAGFLFPEDKFALSRNWAVEPKGLRFFYNQYEIAPGATGSTIVIVDWAGIAHLLRPGSGIGPARR